MLGTAGRLDLLVPPYAHLRTLEAKLTALRAQSYGPGTALVWSMATKHADRVGQLLRARPGGLALLVVLPGEEDLADSRQLAAVLHSARPHGVLPYHPEPSGLDLAQLLRRPPGDLGGEVVDYVRWRGFAMDRDTVRLLRRILDLSAELRTVSSLSRSMYLSRRALGRRLASKGLPVPSHWLQVGRLLRVAARLQNSDATISSIAFEHGYPDGFSLSNQMERLMGYRPSEVRRCLGWEWLIESWLRREAAHGGLRPSAHTHPDSGFDPILRSSSGPTTQTVRRLDRRPTPGV